MQPQNLKAAEIAFKKANDLGELGNLLNGSGLKELIRYARGAEAGANILPGAAAGGVAGAGLGLIKDPGYDEKTGKRKSRLAASLKNGLLGAAAGGATTSLAGIEPLAEMGANLGGRANVMKGQFLDNLANMDTRIKTSAETAFKQARCWEGYEPVPGKKPYTPDSCRPKGSEKKEEKKELKKEAGGAWTRAEGKNPDGGLNAKGRASLKAEGRNIKPPVTEDNPTGERAARRKSFCARSKGILTKMTNPENARDPESRINKARRKWKC